MYTKLIHEIPLPWHATLLVAAFPAYGSVSFVGSVRGGTRAAKNMQIARVHASMLLDGTAKRGKKEIQLFLDSTGASLSFSVTRNRLTFSGRVREKHLDALLAFVAEALLEPTFPQEELEMLKKRDLASLALAAQDTHTQADIALARLLFKRDHPNFAPTTDESREELNALTREDLLEHHQRIVGRDDLILALAGNITRPLAKKLTQKHFKSLPRKEATVPTFALERSNEAKRARIAIEHKASIDYMVGLSTGITSDHKEYAALLLGLQILGNPGGFTGRLMTTVREQEGLTYGVYAYLSGFTSEIDGYINIWGTFAPQLFEQGRDAMLREIRKIVEQGATQEEVRKHRELYVARSRVQLANSGAIARAAHEVVAQGYSVERLDAFPQKVLRLTAKEVNAVLKKYLRPDGLSESAAGPVGNSNT
jgi:predicted Zn-dependent peptidase